MLGSSTGPIVIAFDEIGATRKLFPGLWYQFGHFQQYQNFRLQELFTQHPSDNHKDTRDLYLAFIVLIRTLRGRYGFRSILVDTNFSLYDIDDMVERSAMRGSLKACTSGYFHRLTTQDMYSLVQRYFEMPATMPLELEQELRIFEGRPIYFVEQAFATFLSHCSENKPTSPEDVISLLLNASKDTVTEAIRFFDQRVAKAWNKIRAPAPAGSPTVSTSLASLDAMLRRYTHLEDKMELTEEQIRDLSATGMIFGHQKEVDGKFTYQPRLEPLTFRIIREFTNRKVRRPLISIAQRDDHVWSHCSGSGMILGVPGENITRRWSRGSLCTHSST